MSRTSRLRLIVAATAPAVLALTLGGFLVAHGAKANSTIAVSSAANNATASGAIAIKVNAANVLRTVPGIVDGLNTAVYDGHLNDSASTTAIAHAGIGSTS